LAETLRNVDDLKRQDAENRSVHLSQWDRDAPDAHKVRVTYARGETFENLDTGFVGRVEGEGADRRIDFSVVRDVTLAGRDGATATLKLTLFPDISSEDLLSKKPTYRDLKKAYTRTVNMRVALRSPRGGDLAFVGESHRWASATDPAGHKAFALFKDLPVGQTIELETQPWSHPWWWAIRSVAGDPAYPHRIILGE
jgi:hypothetical protein